MRVTNLHQYDQYVNHMRKANADFFKAQRQVMSGQRFELASEDPLGTSLIVNARSLRSRLSQLDANLRVAKEYTGLTENALAESTDLMRSAYTLALTAANSTMGGNERQALATQVKELQTRLVSLANTQGSSGQYIFAGQAAGKPFAATPPSLTFSGDSNPIRVEIRPGETMQVDLAGAGSLFQSAFAELESLKDNILTGNPSQLSGTNVPNLQKVLNQIIGARGDSGAKMQTIQSLEDENARRIDDLTKDISDVQEVDMTEAVTRMKQAETAFQAALQVTSMGNKLSLMDFMR
ncbi:MAG: flagellar hook-associated protein FlgL [Fimbriimonadaceae bacterium]|jgi:flagellar hook-associated protein 3 FlgL|nr:flagellar hook-associated protein FlgL [Fimbriimonadaceae bacterium]